MSRHATGRVPDQLAELAAGQDGVLRRGQLLTAGVDRHGIRNRLVARRRQTAGRAVVVLHNGPLTLRQRLWVAVLSRGSVAAAAGLTAAVRHGLRWLGEEPIHVVVSARAHPARLPGVRIHVSRRFSAADVHPMLAPPTVRLERALVDAAARAASPRRACGVLAAGVQQRLTTAGRLRAELPTAGQVRHRTLLLAVLDDIAGGAQSFAEIDLGRLARRAGLPEPRRQAVRLDRSGRRRYLDADFGGFSIEVDGAAHLLPLVYWDDMARQNDLLVVTGVPILRFPAVALRVNAAGVVAQLRAAARRFGDAA